MMRNDISAFSVGSPKGSRNNMVQIFRALAVIAVVLIHTTPSGYCQVFFRPFVNFAVALFLFLSGYLTKVENDNWGAFYKKRIIRVIIPYVIWTVLYALVARQLNKLPENLLTANVIVPMYYIFVYIQFVLLTPLLGRLAKSRYQFLGWFVAPTTIMVFNYYWLYTGTEINPSIKLIWNDSCFGWFTFYYFGLILGNRIIEKHYSLKILAIIYFAAIVLEMAEGFVWLKLGGKNCGTQLKLTTILTSTIFLLIVYTILQRGRFDIKNRFLRMVGDYSFGIYLCHVMVLNFLKGFNTIYEYIPFPINAVIVLLVSLCFCHFTCRVCGEKVGKWLGLR